VGPPKISLEKFRRPLFSAAQLWPPKINVYFRLVFLAAKNRPKATENSLFSTAKALFSAAPDHRK
jgi:hypothetical protein